MAKQYRVNTFVRMNNSIISFLLHLGIGMGSFALLTVRGRKVADLLKLRSRFLFRMGRTI